MASDDEDAPLIFRNRKHVDERLEISKTFIICFTNLKLAVYYLEISEFEESKKYFCRSFSKLNINKEIFRIKIIEENIKDLFIYIKYFILCFKPFNLINLINQSNLKLETKSKISLIFDEFNKLNDKKKDFSKENFIQKELVKTKEFINEKCDYKCSKMINDEDENAEIEFIDIGKLFDFFISEERFKIIFVLEIKKIIEIMDEIIYTSPYPILFGRLTNFIKSETCTNRKDIDDSFYQGFGILHFALLAYFKKTGRK